MAWVGTGRAETTIFPTLWCLVRTPGSSVCSWCGQTHRQQDTGGCRVLNKSQATGRQNRGRQSEAASHLVGMCGGVLDPLPAPGGHLHSAAPPEGRHPPPRARVKPGDEPWASACSARWAAFLAPAPRQPLGLALCTAAGCLAPGGWQRSCERAAVSPCASVRTRLSRPRLSAHLPQAWPAVDRAAGLRAGALSTGSLSRHPKTGATRGCWGWAGHVGMRATPSGSEGPRPGEELPQGLRPGAAATHFSLACFLTEGGRHHCAALPLSPFCSVPRVAPGWPWALVLAEVRALWESHPQPPRPPAIQPGCFVASRIWGHLRQAESLWAHLSLGLGLAVQIRPLSLLLAEFSDGMLTAPHPWQHQGHRHRTWASSMSGGVVL